MVLASLWFTVFEFTIFDRLAGPKRRELDDARAESASAGSGTETTTSELVCLFTSEHKTTGRFVIVAFPELRNPNDARAIRRGGSRTTVQQSAATPE
jgi:hypothetical protein